MLYLSRLLNSMLVKVSGSFEPSKNQNPPVTSTIDSNDATMRRHTHDAHVAESKPSSKYAEPSNSSYSGRQGTCTEAIANAVAYKKQGIS
jgi:hypothetical protein